MTEFEGQCLCGGVRFVATAPSLFCGHCHCGYCRQAHGAAFVTWVGFPQASVQVTAEEGVLRWYRSSEQSRRGFCTRCGTTIFFESVVAPGERHIARASIPGAIDREPEFHTFSDQKVEWISLADGLPSLTSEHPLLAGYKSVAKESKPPPSDAALLACGRSAWRMGTAPTRRVP